MEDFKDKVAVVTGGASGVGNAIGEALAKQGAKVVLTDIEESKLKVAKEELSSYGDLISVKQADVSNPKSMDDLNSFVTKEIGDVQKGWEKSLQVIFKENYNLPEKIVKSVEDLLSTTLQTVNVESNVSYLKEKMTSQQYGTNFFIKKLERMVRLTISI